MIRSISGHGSRTHVSFCRGRQLNQGDEAKVLSFDLLEKSIKIDPSNWNAWYGKGKVWGLKGNDFGSIDRKYDAMKAFETALNAYTKALELNPKDYTIWEDRGFALTRIGKNDEAIKCFDKAIEIKSDFYQAWAYKGDALDRLGKKDEAIKCYDKAVSIKPDFFKALNNKGIVLFDLGKYEEAI